MGLDGLCITDHESNNIMDLAKNLAREHQFLLIVGMELLTYEGDLLVFGLEEVPTEKMHAIDLVKLAWNHGGVCISAHPFRDNGRGMGAYIKDLTGLAGVEAFNGNTSYVHNHKAYKLAKNLDLPCLGGSDAHRLERVGQYATCFPDGIRDEHDLILAIREGAVYPLVYEENNYKEVIKCTNAS